MGKTGRPDPARKTPWFLPAGAMLFTALLAAGALLFHRTLVPHRQTRQQARKEAFVRADRLALYSSIASLEQDRRQNVAGLIKGLGGQTNANAALVRLYAANNWSFPIPVTNLAGLHVFVDPWGLPYRITIATNTEASGAFGRHVEGRVVIERGIAN